LKVILIILIGYRGPTPSPDGRTISAGSPGNIRDIYQVFKAYLVKFDGVGLPRMIADNELKAC
jgi:hypothetical protein